jgi:hypothetical protein
MITGHAPLDLSQKERKKEREMVSAFRSSHTVSLFDWITDRSKKKIISLPSGMLESTFCC